MIGNQLTSIIGSPISGKASDSANVLIGFIIMAIGYIIGMCGTLASFMKVFTELINEETDESISNTIHNQNEKELNNFEDDTKLKSNNANKLMKRLKLVKGQ